jgi:hypothetical protein
MKGAILVMAILSVESLTMAKHNLFGISDHLVHLWWGKMFEEYIDKMKLTITPFPKSEESLSSYIARTASNRCNRVDPLTIRKCANIGTTGPVQYTVNNSFMHQLDWLPMSYNPDRLSYLLGVSKGDIVSLTFTSIFRNFI